MSCLLLVSWSEESHQLILISTNQVLIKSISKTVNSVTIYNVLQQTISCLYDMITEWKFLLSKFHLHLINFLSYPIKSYPNKIGLEYTKKCSRSIWSKPFRILKTSNMFPS